MTLSASKVQCPLTYLQVMRSASNVMCLLSIYIPWLSIVTRISFMIVCLAASMPSVAPTS